MAARGAGRSGRWSAWLLLVAQVGAQGAALGSKPPLHCPDGPNGLWPAVLEEVNHAFDLLRDGRGREAQGALADVLDVATADLEVAHGCSLGVAAAYRVLALVHVVDPALQGRAKLRSLQLALRFMHLASNWLTHTFVKHNHDTDLIDSSAWPLTLQESADEHRVVAGMLSESGRQSGHRPSPWPVPHDIRVPGLSIGIVSLCAYPKEHQLPIFSMPIQRMYAERHGYGYHVATERVDGGRPHAWGKVKLMQKYVKERKYDWVMWADCDVYFMNLTVTLDSLLLRYGAAPGASGPHLGKEALDPNFHFLVTEDHAMLNTGIFITRSSSWSDGMLERAWGPEDSIWANHPWWEQASMSWDFWSRLHEQFRHADHRAWVAKAGDTDDEMEGIYPPEVRIAPQGEFNSYHPITSRFLADTWAPGKFVVAFNGVTSGSSPNVADHLYGSYYEIFCQVNDVQEQCRDVPELLPWRAATREAEAAPTPVRYRGA